VKRIFAARHFVSLAIVKQRLRLASVSPKLHERLCRRWHHARTVDGLLGHGRPGASGEAWDNVSRSGNDEPYQIRRMLTENSVRASDRRAQFVGLNVYEQSGGTVLRDLFAHDDAAGCRICRCSIVSPPKS